MIKSFNRKRFTTIGLLIFAAVYFLKLVREIVRSAIGSGMGFPGRPVGCCHQISDANLNLFPAEFSEFSKEKRLADFEKPAAFPANPGFGSFVCGIPGLLLDGLFCTGRQLFHKKLLFKIC